MPGDRKVATSARRGLFACSTLSVSISCQSIRGTMVQPPPTGGRQPVDQLQLVPQVLRVRRGEFGALRNRRVAGGIEERKRRRTARPGQQQHRRQPQNTGP